MILNDSLAFQKHGKPYISDPGGDIYSWAPVHPTVAYM